MLLCAPPLSFRSFLTTAPPTKPPLMPSLRLLLRHRPRTPGHQPLRHPIYSNAAFQILAYVLESITSTPFPTLLTNKLLKPLNLTSTSYAVPPTTNTASSIIPLNATASWYNANLLDESPAGGCKSPPHPPNPCQTEISVAGNDVILGAREPSDPYNTTSETCRRNNDRFFMMTNTLQRH